MKSNPWKLDARNATVDCIIKAPAAVTWARHASYRSRRSRAGGSARWAARRRRPACSWCRCTRSWAGSSSRRTPGCSCRSERWAAATEPGAGCRHPSGIIIVLVSINIYIHIMKINIRVKTSWKLSSSHM